MTSVPLLDAAAARAGDAAAVAAGETWHGLMSRAAGHLARGAIRAAGGCYGRRVVVVVGGGNNGGDGWAAAPRLRARGAHVTVVSTVPLDASMSVEATAFRESWIRSGGRVAEGQALRASLSSADVVIDCMLGTGSRGAPRAEVATAVEEIRVSAPTRATVVACDMPTGVDSDTGAVAGPVVTADLTVTFGARKRGLLLSPGREHVGTLVVGSLGRHYVADAAGWSSLSARGAVPAERPPDDEKRRRGTVMVIAGSVGAAGAAILATRGALSEAGLVTLATPERVQQEVAPAIPAAMTRPLSHPAEFLTADALADLVDIAESDSVVVGPGLGIGEGTAAVANHALAHARRVVLDADALNVFRTDPSRLGDHGGDLVLTPHARELARIGGGSDEVEAWGRRVEDVPRLAREYRATIVAKGPGTLVAAPDGRVWVTPVGGPELASGGTGDVLAGMLGAAIATADDVPLAVARTVWLHAFTGGLLAGQSGSFGPASNLADALPIARAALVREATRRPDWPHRTGRHAGWPDEDPR